MTKPNQTYAVLKMKPKIVTRLLIFSSILKKRSVKTYFLCIKTACYKYGFNSLFIPKELYFCDYSLSKTANFFMGITVFTSLLRIYIQRNQRNEVRTAGRIVAIIRVTSRVSPLSDKSLPFLGLFRMTALTGLFE